MSRDKQILRENDSEIAAARAEAITEFAESVKRLSIWDRDNENIDYIAKKMKEI